MGRTDRIMDALRFTDADLYEGDEDSRRVARERRRRQARVDAARANRSWLELPPDGIEHHGRYVVDKHDGRLFERLRPGVDVWPGGDPSQGLLNPDVADAFVVVDGDVVFLRRARGGAETIDDLRWLEADREDQAARARAMADEELNDFRASQPRVPVLLADVVGHDLPTLRQAIQTIIDCGANGWRLPTLTIVGSTTT